MDLDQKFNWKIQKLERACSHPSVDSDNLYTLAEAYFQKGYYLGRGESWLNLCLQRIQKVIDREDDFLVQALTLQANALYGKAEWKQASAAYRRAIELQPAHALAYVGLGNLEKQRQDFRKARAFFAKAVELDVSLWQAHYNLGRACYEEGNLGKGGDNTALFERAIYHLIEALKHEPIETFIPNVYKELGELFLYTRRYDDAKKFFTRLTKHERHAPLAHYYLGMTNYALGKHKSAITHYRRYLKHADNSAMAYAKIALAYLELGDYDQTQEACEAALALDEKNVLAQFTLGCALLDLQDFASSRQHFEAILEHSPEYLPAYVELAKNRFLAKDYDWLFRQLESEISQFEQHAGYEGGRGCYKGERGRIRRHIDVLLDQLADMGQGCFRRLTHMLALIETDSLRFQIWENLYDLSLQHKVDTLVHKLGEAHLHFSPELGREIVSLSQYLPTQALIAGYETRDEQLRKRALDRLDTRDDISAYKRAIEEVEKEFRSFKGSLLRALAVKGTSEAELFLADSLDDVHHDLRISSAVALVYYGNKQALMVLENELEGLQGPAKQVLQALIRTGWERHSERHKVIRLKDLSLAPKGTAPGPQPISNRPPKLHSCSRCDRHQREVQQMLAGDNLMICTDCVQDVWQKRGHLLSESPAEKHCNFCDQRAEDVAALYNAQGPDKRRSLHICGRCLDLSMGVIQQEEVQKFLQDFR